MDSPINIFKQNNHLSELYGFDASSYVAELEAIYTVYLTTPSGKKSPSIKGITSALFRNKIFTIKQLLVKIVTSNPKNTNDVIDFLRTMPRIEIGASVLFSVLEGLGLVDIILNNPESIGTIADLPRISKKSPIIVLFHLGLVSSYQTLERKGILTVDDFLDHAEEIQSFDRKIRVAPLEFIYMTLHDHGLILESFDYNPDYFKSPLHNSVRILIANTNIVDKDVALRVLEDYGIFTGEQMVQNWINGKRISYCFTQLSVMDNIELEKLYNSLRVFAEI